MSYVTRKVKCRVTAPTVVHFVPDAAGRWVHDLHTSVSNGAIKLMILREEQAMQ